MNGPEQLTLDGRAVPHDRVVRGPSDSRMVRRPTLAECGLDPTGDTVAMDFAIAVMEACNRANIYPGDSFYVARVPPAPRPDANTPGASHAGDPATSRKAARDNAPRAGTQRMAVLREVIRWGDRGRTAEEIGHEMFLSTPSGNSAAKRLSELKQGGYVEWNGETRRTEQGSDAQVFVATAKGRAA